MTEQNNQPGQVSPLPVDSSMTRYDWPTGRKRIGIGGIVVTFLGLMLGAKWAWGFLLALAVAVATGALISPWMGKGYLYQVLWHKWQSKHASKTPLGKPMETHGFAASLFADEAHKATPPDRIPVEVEVTSLENVEGEGNLVTLHSTGRDTIVVAGGAQPTGHSSQLTRALTSFGRTMERVGSMFGVGTLGAAVTVRVPIDTVRSNAYEVSVMYNPPPLDASGEAEWDPELAQRVGITDPEDFGHWVRAAHARLQVYTEKADQAPDQASMTLTHVAMSLPRSASWERQPPSRRSAQAIRTSPVYVAKQALVELLERSGVQSPHNPTPDEIWRFLHVVADPGSASEWYRLYHQARAEGASALDVFGRLPPGWIPEHDFLVVGSTAHRFFLMEDFDRSLLETGRLNSLYTADVPGLRYGVSVVWETIPRSTVTRRAERRMEREDDKNLERALAQEAPRRRHIKAQEAAQIMDDLADESRGWGVRLNLLAWVSVVRVIGEPWYETAAALEHASERFRKDVLGALPLELQLQPITGGHEQIPRFFAALGVLL